MPAWLPPRCRRLFAVACALLRAAARRLRSMAAEPAAADAAGDAEEAAPATTVAALPRALLAKVLARLPVDARLRCSEVCRDWRHVLTTEHSLWTALDLSESSGVMHAVTDALLRAAAAKAGGALTALNLTGCYARCYVSYAALLEVVACSSASLSELRMARALCIDQCTCANVAALLCAAPRLALMLADAHCDTLDATRMLRCEGVFQPLRVGKLHVADDAAADAADDDDDDDDDNRGDGARVMMSAFAAALAAYATPLLFLGLTAAPLGESGALDALVDAALANRLVGVSFVRCGLSPAAAVPALARLLGGGALTSLSVHGCGVQLLDAPAAALLGGALRANGVLQRLTLKDVCFWRDGFSSLALLTSLTAHPSLRELDLSMNRLAPEHAACAGTALFGLVAANAPALHTLNVSFCSLGDAELLPLFDALPRNAHLRTLCVVHTGMSEAFARDVLLPAVRANTSLTQLTAGDGAVTREAKDIVAQRRTAARG
jgi:hypothetical protein